MTESYASPRHKGKLAHSAAQQIRHVAHAQLSRVHRPLSTSARSLAAPRQSTPLRGAAAPATARDAVPAMYLLLHIEERMAQRVPQGCRPTNPKRRKSHPSVAEGIQPLIFSNPCLSIHPPRWRPARWRMRDGLGVRLGRVRRGRRGRRGRRRRRRGRRRGAHAALAPEALGRRRVVDQVAAHGVAWRVQRNMTTPAR
jgi:hypothetical protein